MLCVLSARALFFSFFCTVILAEPLVTCLRVLQSEEYLEAPVQLCVRLRAHAPSELACSLAVMSHDAPDHRRWVLSMLSRMFVMLGWGIDIPAWCLCRCQQLAGTALNQWLIDQTAIREAVLLITNLTSTTQIAAAWPCTLNRLEGWISGLIFF